MLCRSHDTGTATPGGYLSRAVRLPSLRTVFLILAAANAVVFVLIALGVAYLIGNLWWAILIAPVLLLLGLPPVFVVKHELERVLRRRRAQKFRARGEGRGLAFGASDRESMA